MPKKRLTRDDKREANRSRILVAAGTVFGRRGYHGATIEEIADEAGLSNGAVYYNFESKEDLFLGLLERWRAELLREVETTLGRLDRGDAGPAALRDAVRSIVDTVKPSRDWRLLLLEFVTYAARNPKFRARFVVGREKFKSALTDALEHRTLAAGLEPRIPAEHQALLLTALVNGLSVEELTDPGSVPDELLGEAIDAFLEPS